MKPLRLSVLIESHKHRGFGPPDYWVQVGSDDERWTPVRGTEASAQEAAAIALADPAIDYCLIIRGTVPRGSIPSTADIVGDVQREPVPGAVQGWVVDGALKR